MDERYRLVFRGEILEGHHEAVAKKKLATVLGIKDDAKLAALFAGKPVVLRKDADTKTAAKFQAAFKKAGVRLRVMPVVLSIEELEAQEAESIRLAEEAKAERERQEALAAMPDQADFADSSAWAVMPPGSPVLKEEEREEETVAEVPTDHIQLDTAAKFAPDEPTESEPAPEIQAPDFDVAELGAVMGTDSKEDDNETSELLLDVDFSVADAGVVLVPPSPPVEVPESLVEADFDLADPGVELGTGVEQSEEVSPPDVSHIELIEEQTDEDSDALGQQSQRTLNSIA